MASKKLIGLVTAAALAVGAYWHWSPYITLYQLKSSAEAQDAESFNSHINYPKLRESLKSEFAAKVTKNLEKDTETDSEAAAIGKKMALGMANSLVDAMVQPEVVMKAMKNGSLNPAQIESSMEKLPEGEKPKVDWTSEREGLNRFVLHVDSENTERSARVSLVLEREGFADWKLAGVRMPDME